MFFQELDVFTALPTLGSTSSESAFVKVEVIFEPASAASENESYARQQDAQEETRRSSNRESVVPSRYTVASRSAAAKNHGKRRRGRPSLSSKKIPTDSSSSTIKKNVDRVRRGRRFFYTDGQREALQEGFKQFLEFPSDWRRRNSSCMQDLCARTGLTRKQVDKWFYSNKVRMCKKAKKQRKVSPYAGSSTMNAEFPPQVQEALNDALQGFLQNPSAWGRNSRNRIDLQNSMNLTNLQVSDESLYSR